MIDKEKILANFRTRLDTDPQLRRQFEQSPLGTMRRAGVQVTPGNAQQLRRELIHGPVPHVRPTVFSTLPPFVMHEHGPKVRR